jgi:hypothetical protein
MATIAYLFLIAAVILAVVAVVAAITHRVWSNWLIGAAVCLIIWIVLTYAIH